jgi:hypothetical protein
MTENEGDFSQSESTSPIDNDILDAIGLYVEEAGAEQVLNGTFVPHPNCNPYLKDPLEEMHMENCIKAVGPIPMTSLKEEHKKGWQKQKEQTTVVSLGLLFSDHKAAVKDDNMAKVDQLLCEIPYSQGFSREIYQIITYFKILKKAGVYDIEKMQPMQLFIT